MAKPSDHSTVSRFIMEASIPRTMNGYSEEMEFSVLAHVANDPQCREHTVWLERYGIGEQAKAD